MNLWTLVVLIAGIGTQTTSSYKILIVSPFPATSHWLWIKTFANELLHRGHHVTAITNYKDKVPHVNYTEVIIDPIFDAKTEFQEDNNFDLLYDNWMEVFFMYWTAGTITTEYALKNRNVQAFINRNDLTFDLVISEQFFQEAFLVLAHKYNAPLISIGSLEAHGFVDQFMGHQAPWSVLVHPSLKFSSQMTFSQRLVNTLCHLGDGLVRKYHYLPQHDELVRKYFKNLPEPIPTVEQLEKSVAVSLVNSHRGLSLPRPVMPGQINVGGAHIKKPKPLPTDLREYLDDASDGAILFSLGSYLNSSDMPLDKKEIFISAFGNLSQRVVWKFEDDTLVNMPHNLKVMKWLPQSDILAHPNVKLFITHGGLFGLLESIYRGVPMLFIPFYGDQPTNALKAVKNGFGEQLRFPDITQDSLVTAIRSIIDDPKYANKVQAKSKLFTDNPIEPLDEAMYWIEYVIRHKGATHLKSDALYMSWYAYNLIDVFGFLVVCLFGLAYSWYHVIRRIARSVRREETSKKKRA